jgi:hypothetical protein
MDSLTLERERQATIAKRELPLNGSCEENNPFASNPTIASFPLLGHFSEQMVSSLSLYPVLLLIFPLISVFLKLDYET